MSRALGPVALVSLVLVLGALHWRAELQRAVRLDSRDVARSAGALPPAPPPRRPEGLDHRALSPGEQRTAREADLAPAPLPPAGEP